MVWPTSWQIPCHASGLVLYIDRLVFKLSYFPFRSGAGGWMYALVLECGRLRPGPAYRMITLSASGESPFIDFSNCRDNTLDSSSIRVLPDVITIEEEARLVAELEGNMRRRRYVANHWDSVIERYREVEKRTWIDPPNAKIAQRIKDVILQTLHKPLTTRFLPVHVIDLAEDGFIKPHVDSSKFSGGLVCGLSLCSSAIMQLKGDVEQGQNPDSIVRLLLRPRSLYILCGNARYRYAHEILATRPEGEERWVDGRRVERSRRLSLIFRDEREDQGKREEACETDI